MTVYYDAIRGPLAVKPIEYIEGTATELPKVLVKVTARNTHSGFKTGETFYCHPHNIVKLISGFNCRSLTRNEIKQLIK